MKPEPPPRANTLWGRFNQLPPRRRVLLGISGMAFSIVGLLLTPTEESSQRLVPKGLPGPLYVPPDPQQKAA